MHYFLDDMTSFSAASLLALLLILVPGFGIARIAAWAGLIPPQGSANACWGLLFSPAILPAVDALLLRWTGFEGMLAVHVVLFAMGAGPAVRAASLIPPKWWSAVALCWLAVAWANVDFDWNGNLYQPVTVIDGVKHAAVVGALAQYGLPLHDPFFERQGIAGYYYYFYIGPALIHWLGGALIDSRAAYAGGTFVTLLTFPALLLRLAESAALIPQGHQRRFLRIILLLCCVSGLDLLPGLWIWLKTRDALSQLDWWSEEVRWALTSFLWVPHHMTAIIAVYVGCLVLAETEGRPLTARTVLGGTAFATAFGCSLWIALAAVPIFAAWWLFERLKPNSISIWVLPLCGVIALILSLPQISDILAGRTISGSPLAFYMRPLGPIRVLPHGLTEWIVHLAVTPGGYGIEFGIFALGTIFFLKQGGFAASQSTPIGRLLLIGAPLSLVMVTFVRSAVIYNDFGWRSVWFAEIPAMLWTASYLSRTDRFRTSPIWSAALTLGLAATMYDMVGLRLIRPYYFPGFVNSDPRADFEARGAYAWIDRAMPADLIVQHNPTRLLRSFDFGLYSDHPVGVADVEARLFGADDRAVRARIALIAPIFERPMSGPELRKRAAAAGIDAVLITTADPLWQASGGPPFGWACQYRSLGSCVMLVGQRQ